MPGLGRRPRSNSACKFVLVNARQPPTLHLPTCFLLLQPQRSAAQHSAPWSSQPDVSRLPLTYPQPRRRPCRMPATPNSTGQEGDGCERFEALVACPRGSVPPPPRSTKELAESMHTVAPHNLPWTQGCELKYWLQFQVPSPNTIHTQRRRSSRRKPSRSSQLATDGRARDKKTTLQYCCCAKILACDFYFRLYQIVRAALNYATTTRWLKLPSPPRREDWSRSLPPVVLPTMDHIKYIACVSFSSCTSSISPWPEGNVDDLVLQVPPLPFSSFPKC